MALPIDINQLSTQELNALAKDVENTLAQRERESEKVDVVELDLFGEKSIHTSPELALKELVEYVSDDDFSLFKGVGHVTGILPYVGLRQTLISREEYEQLYKPQ